MAHERFAPDPSLSRTEMEALQREIAADAVFADDLPVTPADVRTEEAVIAGVDQAFLSDGEHAVSAIVAVRGDEVVERVHATAELSIPYIPGLLAFREGPPILAALARLDINPDVYLFDGSGRIHFREAGLATHIGVLRDVPSIGVAKSLLCGAPRRPTDELCEGERVPIEANADVTAPDGTVIGYAYQSRQFASGRINPLYVSPGHRIGATTAVKFVAACGGDYKLPKPIRLADGHVDAVKRKEQS